MIRVDVGPLEGRSGEARALVDEVASISEAAVSLFGECVAPFCLVRSIVLHVNP